MPRLLSIALIALACSATWLRAQEAKEKQAVDLSEFRTLDQAVTTRVTQARPGPTPALPGYLGVNTKADAGGVVSVTMVHADSPAGKAGLKAGDVLVSVDGRGINSADDLRECLQGRGPGTVISLAMLRGQEPVVVKVTLAATSRPMVSGGPKGAGAARPFIGVQFGTPAEGPGVLLEDVVAGSPADKGGLKIGDVLVKLDGKDLKDGDQFRVTLLDRKPGDKVTMTVKRAGKEQDLDVTLGSQDAGGGGRGAGEEVLSIWRKDMYNLAVIVVDFADVKCNENVKPAQWEQALFSHRYHDKTATGQTAHGSLNDYYLEQSFGRFHVEGKVFDVIHAAKKRGDYYQGAGGNPANKTALLIETLNKLIQRGGKDALIGYDGLCFIYAGAAVQTNRGSLYYPHRGNVTFAGKRWPYMICPEGGKTMESMGVFALEFGKLLGLPDLSARADNPGSEGLGVWCLMSNGAGDKGKPVHLSAWCKEQLGWLEPAVIDPTIKQKLILSPVLSSRRQCVKVLIRTDGSEYLLLENRIPRGFDADLPGQGLLIWRVVNGRPLLEEAHGVSGPAGPRVHLDSVPYPSKSNNAFTPNTTPSSRSATGGGLPVNLTNIRRLPDGRITFFVGYEYY